ncbi:hypothetical protein [Actinoallomurus sp. CA-150999]|uniref:hypothetical protein n=1 Tax=Actinoallomurus sp. CA-150999 TaxID=3239887 RepID=UPI003D8A91D4
MFRPLIPLVVLAGVGGLTACSGAAGHTVSASSSTAALCPSAAQVVKVMQQQMNDETFRVTDPIVCDHGWAAAHVELTTAAGDQTQLVLSYTAGQWRGVVYGTDGLCGKLSPERIPEAIKEALGPHC